MKGRIVISTVCLLWVVLCIPPAAAAQQQTSGWKTSLSVHLGRIGSPGVIARGVDAPVGEELRAHLGDPAALGFHVGREHGRVGVHLVLLSPFTRLDVQNRHGVEFPNHAERPLFYSLQAVLFPFGRPIDRGELRPFLVVGGGGALLRMDLDNIDGQSWHHAWAWTSGAGLRIRLKDSGPFLEVQYRRLRVAGNGPIEPFSAWAVTVGAGVAF